MQEPFLRKGEILLTTSEVCKLIRRPLGILIPEEPKIALRWAKLLISVLRPPKLCSVGDFVTLNCLRSQLTPDVAIVDLRVKRSATFSTKAEVLSTYGLVLEVVNPPSCITLEAWEAVRKAFVSTKRTLIRVIGEEDLLTLVASYHAPLKSIILYGQPNEGLVLVYVDEGKKDKIKRILLKMARRFVE